MLTPPTGVYYIYNADTAVGSACLTPCLYNTQHILCTCCYICVMCVIICTRVLPSGLRSKQVQRQGGFYYCASPEQQHDSFTTAA